VFVLRCQSASHLTCLVSFHQVTCHIQFIQSYKLHPYIHALIQSYIHTLILSHIHTFMHTQYVHNVIHAWLHQLPKVLFGYILSVGPQSSLNQATSSNKRTTCNHLISTFTNVLFPSLSDYGISSVSIPRIVGIRNVKCFNSPRCRITEDQNHHSLLCRITEYQVFHSLVYRITECQRVSSPGKSDDEASLNFYSLKCHSPFCRITECQKCHPSLSVQEMSLIKSISMVSSPVYLFKRCH
jgi:hypothetical protein